MNLKKLQILLYLFILLIATANPIFANEHKQDLEKQIQEYQKKLDDARQQKNTLSSQIQLMDTQIYLTNLKTQETEKKIETTERELNVLGARIEGLDSSLNQLSKTMLNFVVDGYKQRNVSLLDVLLDSDNANDLMSKVKYYSAARSNNEKVMLQVQETKINFQEQKDLREKKVTELDALKTTLETQKVDLAAQQDSKQKLLEVTKNDERTYQALLEKARAEYAAIQGIIAGAGTETKIKDVTKGESIATIIPGASCNSSGGHLHFITQQNGSVTNPFNYLKSVDSQNCSGSSCGSGDGDPFNPSGNWDWPLTSPINMFQGYGSTWAVRNTWVGSIYNFHNGIDIKSPSLDVTAVADGTLYRGSYAVGCTLSYVKLVHKDTDMETLYLHVYGK